MPAAAQAAAWGPKCPDDVEKLRRNRRKATLGGKDDDCSFGFVLRLPRGDVFGIQCIQIPFI